MIWKFRGIQCLYKNYWFSSIRQPNSNILILQYSSEILSFRINKWQLINGKHKMKSSLSIIRFYTDRNFCLFQYRQLYLIDATFSWCINLSRNRLLTNKKNLFNIKATAYAMCISACWLIWFRIGRFSNQPHALA